MQVIEHQYLHYRNVLVFEVQMNTATIAECLSGIADSLNVLGLQPNGKTIFTCRDSVFEFVVPVGRTISSCQYYRFKPEFKLVNAVRARHYGSFSCIEDKVKKLFEYLAEHSLSPVTQPYYVARCLESEIYDIYIGINENVL